MIKAADATEIKTITEKINIEINSSKVEEIACKGILRVTLVKGQNLEKKDLFGKSDPYATIQVGDNKYKTKVVNNNQNPEWNRDFDICVDGNENASVHIEVFDKDTFGKDDSLGMVNVEIGKLMQAGEMWVDLTNCKSGQLFITSTFREIVDLTPVVEEAKDNDTLVKDKTVENIKLEEANLQDEISQPYGESFSVDSKKEINVQETAESHLDSVLIQSSNIKDIETINLDISKVSNIDATQSCNSNEEQIFSEVKEVITIVEMSKEQVKNEGRQLEEVSNQPIIQEPADISQTIAKDETKVDIFEEVTEDKVLKTQTIVEEFSTGSIEIRTSTNSETTCSNSSLQTKEEKLGSCHDTFEIISVTESKTATADVESIQTSDAVKKDQETIDVPTDKNFISKEMEIHDDTAARTRPVEEIEGFTVVQENLSDQVEEKVLEREDSGYIHVSVSSDDTEDRKNQEIAINDEASQDIIHKEVQSLKTAETKATSELSSVITQQSETMGSFDLFGALQRMHETFDSNTVPIATSTVTASVSSTSVSHSFTTSSIVSGSSSKSAEGDFTIDEEKSAGLIVPLASTESLQSVSSSFKESASSTFISSSSSVVFSSADMSQVSGTITSSESLKSVMDSTQFSRTSTTESLETSSQLATTSAVASSVHSFASFSQGEFTSQEEVTTVDSGKLYTEVIDCKDEQVESIEFKADEDDGLLETVSNLQRSASDKIEQIMKTIQEVDANLNIEQEVVEISDGLTESYIHITKVESSLPAKEKSKDSILSFEHESLDMKDGSPTGSDIVSSEQYPHLTRPSEEPEDEEIPTQFENITSFRAHFVQPMYSSTEGDLKSTLDAINQDVKPDLKQEDYSNDGKSSQKSLTADKSADASPRHTISTTSTKVKLDSDAESGLEILSSADMVSSTTRELESVTLESGVLDCASMSDKTLEGGFASMDFVTDIDDDSKDMTTKSIESMDITFVEDKQSSSVDEVKTVKEDNKELIQPVLLAKCLQEKVFWKSDSSQNQTVEFKEETIAVVTKGSDEHEQEVVSGSSSPGVSTESEVSFLSNDQSRENITSSKSPLSALKSVSPEGIFLTILIFLLN